MLRPDKVYAGYAWDRNPVPSKMSIGWAVGAEVTPRRFYGRRKPIFKGGQDGRVVKAGALGGTHD